MAANENFNLNLQNEEEEFVVDFGETTNLGGGGGTTNFNELTNRPKYDNITMTGGTNIPKVPTKTSELTNDANFATKTEVGTAVEIETLARENADTTLNTAITSETTARQNADNGLQSQIDAIVASSDVKDIVGTYAELQAYDTSTLGNNDIIKVLQDETHSNETTYYRWSTATSSFSLIGEEGPYYTKAQTDILLNGKQNILTAGNNIQISGDTISATDTTYTAGNNVDITNGVISATDTTYADFTGTDGTAAGSAGLVPAPATTDAGKFLKADGTWDTAGGSITPVQTTGTSTTDVMSQNAVTSMVFADPATQYKIKIGSGTASNEGINAVEIGRNSSATGSSAVAIGVNASAKTSSVAIGGNNTATYAPKAMSDDSIAIGNGATVDNNCNMGIAIGTGAHSTARGQMDIGIDAVFGNVGYNNSAYRLLTGLYDGQSAHDAATRGQLDSIAVQNAGAPTTSTVGTVGQLLEDTTNGKLYICTDATNPYVWEEVGAGGGGGPTVVQTTGTSTTDVMSQNAVTGMVFADPATGQKVAIGSGITNSSSYGTALGCQAYIMANSDRSVALGYRASVNGGKGGVALGTGASVTHTGEVNIGSVTSTAYGYNNSNYRLLTGLYDGQSAHDAVTVEQVNATIDAINTALSTNIPHIGANS